MSAQMSSADYKDFENIKYAYGKARYYAVDNLPGKEPEVLKLRFGIGDTNPMTYKKIGEILGFSTERARQLVRQALSRLFNYNYRMHVIFQFETTLQDLIGGS